MKRFENASFEFQLIDKNNQPLTYFNNNLGGYYFYKYLEVKDTYNVYLGDNLNGFISFIETNVYASSTKINLSEVHFVSASTFKNIYPLVCNELCKEGTACIGESFDYGCLACKDNYFGDELNVKRMICKSNLVIKFQNVIHIAKFALDQKKINAPPAQKTELYQKGKLASAILAMVSMRKKAHKRAIPALSIVKSVLQFQNAPNVPLDTL